MQVTVDLPDNYASFLDENQIKRALRLHHGLILFSEHRISVSKAADIAGIDIYAFMEACAAQQIPVMDEDLDTLRESVNAYRGGPA